MVSGDTHLSPSSCNTSVEVIYNDALAFSIYVYTDVFIF
ncbi:unnamed protein product [Arabidopsis thaliana]|uniref:Uncharacterized protein n=2 Tax=Arabidopsis thaliana TaxID=3702 RepID=A0A654FFP8_ARATH|nr:uncharacterized protein AT3G24514 [Arabidopsis thaliana]ANM63467.1 hypothetical protein AT3G24514 [Arabidopsis thaliana]VYS58482.1 unnamed protein product [Arabidopsis thaliana]|eukprot:NP_001325553.1 hypothetical protein AT3G24514 [Arabidopsis thaliana]